MVQDIPEWETAIKVAIEARGGNEPTDLVGAFSVIEHAASLLLYSKQQKYGKDNILTFKHQGLIIRMNDKIQRLISGHFKGADLGKEGTVESYGDLVGYGILGISLEKGWFTLPLTKEVVK